MKASILAALLAASTIAVSAAATMPALTGSEFQTQAKISLKQAQAKALAVAHGTIVGQELEKESGGLRYSFDIRVGTAIHEVGIDASSGKVLENSIETGND